MPPASSAANPIPPNNARKTAGSEMPLEWSTGSPNGAMRRPGRRCAGVRTRGPWTLPVALVVSVDMGCTTYWTDGSAIMPRRSSSSNVIVAVRWRLHGKLLRNQSACSSRSRTLRSVRHISRHRTLHPRPENRPVFPPQVDLEIFPGIHNPLFYGTSPEVAFAHACKSRRARHLEPGAIIGSRCLPQKKEKPCKVPNLLLVLC